MKQETAILTSRLKQREPAACQQLLSDYGPAVFRIVQRIVTQHEDAEEVYQDVFVKVLRSIDSYDPDQASLSTWISRIAYHEAMMACSSSNDIEPEPEPEKIDFHCNRPFVYVIQEYSSGVVFFVGTFRG